MRLIKLLEQRKAVLELHWMARRPGTGYNTVREIKRLEKRISGLQRCERNITQ